MLQREKLSAARGGRELCEAEGELLPTVRRAFLAISPLLGWECPPGLAAQRQAGAAEDPRAVCLCVSLPSFASQRFGTCLAVLQHLVRDQ